MGTYIAITVIFLFLGAYLERLASKRQREIGEAVESIMSSGTSFEKLLLIIRNLDERHQLLMMATERALSKISSLAQYDILFAAFSNKRPCEASNLVFKKWNKAWKEGLEECRTEEILDFCDLSHHRNPGLQIVLVSILSEDLIPNANIGLFERVAVYASEFPQVRETAIIMASEYATTVEEVRQLIGRWASSSSHNELRARLNEQLAKLETRSDELSFIMSNNRVDSEAWKIAFNKLKAMKDPAMETSGTYGAP